MTRAECLSLQAMAWLSCSSRLDCFTLRCRCATISPEQICQYLGAFFQIFGCVTCGVTLKLILTFALGEKQHFRWRSTSAQMIWVSEWPPSPLSFVACSSLEQFLRKLQRGHALIPNVRSQGVEFQHFIKLPPPYLQGRCILFCCLR